VQTPRSLLTSPRRALAAAVAVICCAGIGFGLGRSAREEQLTSIHTGSLAVHVGSLRNSGSVGPLCGVGKACGGH
jgi:hypothetical protein